jgi:hypothetical protein
MLVVLRTRRRTARASIATAATRKAARPGLSAISTRTETAGSVAAPPCTPSNNALAHQTNDAPFFVDYRSGTGVLKAVRPSSVIR